MTTASLPYSPCPPRRYSLTKLFLLACVSHLLVFSLFHFSRAFVCFYTLYADALFVHTVVFSCQRFF